LYFDWKYTPEEGAKVPAIGLHVDGWSGNTHSERPLRWLRLDGQYYYQSLTGGHFYCKSNKQSITLDEAIKRYGP